MEQHRQHAVCEEVGGGQARCIVAIALCEPVCIAAEAGAVAADLSETGKHGGFDQEGWVDGLAVGHFKLLPWPEWRDWNGGVLHCLISGEEQQHAAVRQWRLRQRWLNGSLRRRRAGGKTQQASNEQAAQGERGV